MGLGQYHRIDGIHHPLRRTLNRFDVYHSSQQGCQVIQIDVMHLELLRLAARGLDRISVIGLGREQGLGQVINRSDHAIVSVAQVHGRVCLPFIGRVIAGDDALAQLGRIPLGVGTQILQDVVEWIAGARLGLL